MHLSLSCSYTDCLKSFTQSTAKLPGSTSPRKQHTAAESPNNDVETNIDESQAVAKVNIASEAKTAAEAKAAAEEKAAA